MVLYHAVTYNLYHMTRHILTHEVQWPHTICFIFPSSLCIPNVKVSEKHSDSKHIYIHCTHCKHNLNWLQAMRTCGSNLQVNTLRLRQNGRHFPDNILKRISLNGNVRILIKISPNFVSSGPINNIPALVHIMAWRRSSHYLNQWWLDYQRIYVSLGPNELNQFHRHECIYNIVIYVARPQTKEISLEYNHFISL